MTLKEELFALYDEGKKPVEAMKLGYKKGTVYRFFKDWLMEKEKERYKVLIDESETCKKVFECIENEKNLTTIVKEEGIPPKKVLELHGDYVKLRETDADFHETLVKLDETTNRLYETNEEIEKLKPIREKLRTAIEKMVNSLNSLNLLDLLEAKAEALENEINYFETKRDYGSLLGRKEEEEEELKGINKEIDLRRVELEKIENIIDELKGKKKCRYLPCGHQK